FEYHPENIGTRYEVLLGLLGRDYLTVINGGTLPAPRQAATAPAPNASGTPAPGTRTPGTPTPPPTPTRVWEAPPPWPDKLYGAPPDYPPPPSGPFLRGPQVGYGIIADLYYKDR